jgi:hypothetical protein
VVCTECGMVVDDASIIGSFCRKDRYVNC